jgi:hypothetical protein
MKFDDDYLWDGTGEPDPEVERLENLLAGYRTQRPAPEMPERPAKPTTLVRPWRVYVPAIAASVLVMSMTLGLWLEARRGQYSSPVAPAVNGPAIGPGSIIDLGYGSHGIDDVTTPPSGPPKGPREIAQGGGHPVKPFQGRPVVGPVTPTPEIAKAAPEPLLDTVTAQHVEQVEMLLRSFRNAGDDPDAAVEIAYDRKRSRELLDRNALLRRSAETRKNLPAQSVLEDLEPYLADIANLDSRPSTDDVRAIQTRMDKHDVVAGLQLYASAGPARGY